MPQLHESCTLAWLPKTHRGCSAIRAFRRVSISKGSQSLFDAMACSRQRLLSPYRSWGIDQGANVPKPPQEAGLIGADEVCDLSSHLYPPLAVDRTRKGLEPQAALFTWDGRREKQPLDRIGFWERRHSVDLSPRASKAIASRDPYPCLYTWTQLRCHHLRIPRRTLGRSLWFGLGSSPSSQAGPDPATDRPISRAATRYTHAGC